MESRQSQLLDLIRDQIRPAVGCTEPAAAAYAAALAVRALNCPAETLTVTVSANILKNAMGVGIPGTDMVGPAHRRGAGRDPAATRTRRWPCCIR